MSVRLSHPAEGRPRPRTHDYATKVSFCGVTQFAVDETFIGLVRFIVVFVPSPKSATEINVGETNEASVGIGCTSATFTTNIVWIPNHQRYFCAAVRTELALWNAKPEFE